MVTSTRSPLRLHVGWKDHTELHHEKKQRDTIRERVAGLIVDRPHSGGVPLEDDDESQLPEDKRPGDL